tara:strand:+ start:262 stop:630 length:369 start_codon:yes stop_codon:yes gene_type:complete
MTKQAAEQIAQQYYQLGSQLALEDSGLSKEAAAPPISNKALKNLLRRAVNAGSVGATGLAGLGLGAIGGQHGLATLKEAIPGFRNLIQTSTGEDLAHILAALAAGGIGASKAIKHAPKLKIR